MWSVHKTSKLIVRRGNWPKLSQKSKINIVKMEANVSEVGTKQTGKECEGDWETTFRMIRRRAKACSQWKNQKTNEKSVGEGKSRVSEWQNRSRKMVKEREGRALHAIFEPEVTSSAFWAGQNDKGGQEYKEVVDWQRAEGWSESEESDWDRVR